MGSFLHGIGLYSLLTWLYQLDWKFGLLDNYFISIVDEQRLENIFTRT